MSEETMADMPMRLRMCAQRVGGGNELARQTGIPRRTLENYLNGKTEPVPSRLIAIADAAGADLIWLLAGSGEFRSASPGSKGRSPKDRLEEMRLISTVLRQAVGQENAHINRQLWTDLQSLAYIHNLSHEAVPAIVGLVVRAYAEGEAQGVASSSSPGEDE